MKRKILYESRHQERIAELQTLAAIKRENHLTREEATAEEKRVRKNWKRRME